jgi:dienelactone hydrolase
MPSPSSCGLLSLVLPCLLLACSPEPSKEDTAPPDERDTETDTEDSGEDTGEEPWDGWELPEPTGAFSIGRYDVQLRDASREETFTEDPEDLRELMVYVWYPAKPTGTMPAAPYVDDATALLLRETLPDYLAEGFVDRILTHAVLGAEPASEGHFPLLVFAPGYGVPTRVYQVFFEELASRGFVVAALDPPFLSGLVVFPDGRTVEAADLDDEGLEEAIEVLAGDFSLVAASFAEAREDAMSALYGLARKMDPDNAAGFGHSFGGAGAVSSCLGGAPFKAALDMDGSLWGEVVGQDPGCPLLIDLSARHEGDASVETTFEAATRPAFLARFADTGHLSFTDGPFLVAGLNPGLGPETWPRSLEFGTLDLDTLLNATRALHRAFFTMTLRSEPADPITAVAPFEEVTVERRN